MFLARTQKHPSPISPKEQSRAIGRARVPISAHPWGTGQGQQVSLCCDTGARADVHQGLYCRDSGGKLDIPLNNSTLGTTPALQDDTGPEQTVPSHLMGQA